MRRSPSRLAELRSQLERVDTLLLAREGPSSNGDDRASLDRQIAAARRHLNTLVGPGPVHPGDLRV